MGGARPRDGRRRGRQCPGGCARLTNIGPLLPRFESGLRAHDVSDGRYGGSVGILLAGIGSALIKFAPGRHSVPVGIALVSLGALVAGVSFSPRPNLSKRWLQGWLRAGVAPIPRRPFLSWVHGYKGGAQRAGTEGRGHPGVGLAPVPIGPPGARARSDPFVAAAGSNRARTRRLDRLRHGPFRPQCRVATLGAPRAGFDEEGYGIQVPDSNRSAGTMVIGDPGQGKTAILLWIFASDLAARWREWKAKGRLRRTVIWLETKGEGAGRALAAARRVGYDKRALCFLDVTVESGAQLDLVDRSDPFASAEALAEAMRYAFSERAIMDESEDILKIVFALALTIPDDLLRSAREDPAQGFMSVAYKLMGGDPVTGAKDRILAQVSKRLGETQEPTGRFGADIDRDPTEDAVFMGDEAGATPLGIAYRAYRSKERSRKADTEAVFAAPRNKVSKLLAASSLWTNDPKRPHISFRQMLEHRMAVVINFGSKDKEAFTDELRARLGAIAVYLLWQAIKQECDGWAASGDCSRFSPTSLLTSPAPGERSRTTSSGSCTTVAGPWGVWPTFATQRLTQLRRVDEVGDSLLRRGQDLPPPRGLRGSRGSGPGHQRHGRGLLHRGRRPPAAAALGHRPYPHRPRSSRRRSPSTPRSMTRSPPSAIELDVTASKGSGSLSKERAASVVIPDILVKLPRRRGCVPRTVLFRSSRERFTSRGSTASTRSGSASVPIRATAGTRWRKSSGSPSGIPAGPKWMARWVTETSPAGGSRKWTAPGGLRRTRRRTTPFMASPHFPTDRCLRVDHPTEGEHDAPGDAPSRARRAFEDGRRGLDLFVDALPVAIADRQQRVRRLVQIAFR